MKYGKQLRRSIYPPWKDQYIDYDRLKQLLRENDESSPTAETRDDDEWTEEDESAFVEELINNQLEKVHSFQADTYQKLRDRTTACEQKLEPISIASKKGEGEAQQEQQEGGESSQSQKQNIPWNDRERILRDALKDLDKITKEVNELEKYSRMNYTGFLKAAKKHDRKRGHAYRVRPLLQVRLSALPFNKEDYSPLLYRLSAMYSFVRQSLEGKTEGLSFSESQTGGETYSSHKFWVHPENLLEVKTVILRRLPVLVYNPQTSKIAEGTQKDPTITSIYFDNPKFSTYMGKVDHQPEASSLRLRWYGQLQDKPEIVFEKKTIKDGNVSEEQRFPIKEKYVEPFIKGEYKMGKAIQRVKERNQDDPSKVEGYESAVNSIQSFIRENDLQPILRANYTRTAFQIPGDDRVRISLDTPLAFVREDAIDADRPCRDPDDWHRSDIDANNLEYPFNGIRKGEINRFPFALLEIKTKGKKQYEWVQDLMTSHLVKETPRFSKFVHGVATLFEDYVNSFPFWLSELETDIRRDPQDAFDEEQKRKQKAVEDEFAVGSLFGARASPAFRASITSPVGSPANKSSVQRGTPSTPGKATADMTRTAVVSSSSGGRQDRGIDEIVNEDDSDDDDNDGQEARDRQQQQSSALSTSGLRSLFPSFSSSKYARFRRGDRPLPPGVSKPSNWIKDEGPVKVEAKVWLANERTFIKWQHVSVLLASLSLGLYNAAGEGNWIARSLAIVYTAVALFAGVWGWGMYWYRMRLIEQRSGKDFDNMLGPIVICVGLIVALCVNFAFKYNAVLHPDHGDDHHHGHHHHHHHDGNSMMTGNFSHGDQTSLKLLEL